MSRDERYTMYVLNIWHTVSEYAEWKKTFDADPLGREASGVRRYSIERPLDDEHQVVGGLEFESLAEAEAFAARLEELWKGEGSRLVSGTGHRITEVVERGELGASCARRAA
jgi:hypothetical protein